MIIHDVYLRFLLHTANTLAQHRLSGRTEGIFLLPLQNNKIELQYATLSSTGKEFIICQMLCVIGRTTFCSYDLAF